MLRQILTAFGILALATVCRAQKILPIWPGIPSSSENWKWHEQEDSLSRPGDPLVYNVVRPTLTFFPADPSVANGTSVIICPGGSFCYLHINTEGADVAKWLNQKGVSAFLLKYRLVHSETDHPMKEKTERMKDPAAAANLLTPLVPLAIADARQAITYVRAHAAELGVSPDKIGIIGFSAGGTLATASAFDYTPSNRPDFVAPIYAYVPPTQLLTVPRDAPPLFVAAATDDDLHLVPMSLHLYSAWLAAGHPAEIHIYSKGGHGFGMNKQGQPSDTWIERFGDWLQIQGFLKKTDPPQPANIQ
ncbi:MAG: alpha/beta hydrolase [Puia sp.]|nr:alpha/beta hydrolase [Puia sp.]